MDIVGLFKRSKEGFMNRIEYHKDGGYVRKRFHNSFLENCYTDFLTTVLGFTIGVKIKSGKNRQYTEAVYLNSLNEKGFPAPRLIKKGNGYNDIGYVEMKELSGILRDDKTGNSKKMKYLRDAAAMLRWMHDEGVERCDAVVSNVGIKPDGNPVFFDFEHESRNPSRRKDVSALAASAAFEIDCPEYVNGVLSSIAEGYGKDLTREMEIVPHAYMAFFFGGKMKNLHEMRKAIRYGIRK